MKTKRQLKWVKTGGDYNGCIEYKADKGGLTILKTRVCGEWTHPSLYTDGVYVCGYSNVADAKHAVEGVLACINAVK